MMKKLSLLLIAGLSAACVQAQEKTSMLSREAARGVSTPEYSAKMTKPFIPKTQNKTSAGSHSSWFSFENANFISATSKSYLTPIYNDSTLYVPGGTPTPFFWYIMGLGTSFDPTSTAFSSPANTSYVPADFTISSTNSYTVDSIDIAGRYDRLPYNDYTDTLNIYLVTTSASGTYRLGYQSDPYFYTNLSIPDSQLHYATENYDSVNNKPASSVTGVIKIQKILDASAFADSTTDGLHEWTFALPSTLSAGAGQKIVAYQQYVSGHAYPFRTGIDSANTWSPLTFELNGAGTYPHQNSKDYNCGLIITSSGRYNIDTQGDYYMGHMVLQTTYLYGSAAHFDDPFFSFHVTCSACTVIDAVNEINNINGVSAYPNPANGELAISFSSAKAVNASVTLTNLIGETIATQNNVTNGKAIFNTKALPAGIYIFSINADGQRTSGRVTVTH